MMGASTVIPCHGWHGDWAQQRSEHLGLPGHAHGAGGRWRTMPSPTPQAPGRCKTTSSASVLPPATPPDRRPRMRSDLGQANVRAGCGSPCLASQRKIPLAQTAPRRRRATPRRVLVAATGGASAWGPQNPSNCRLHDQGQLTALTTASLDVPGGAGGPSTEAAGGAGPTAGPSQQGHRPARGPVPRRCRRGGGVRAVPCSVLHPPPTCLSCAWACGVAGSRALFRSESRVPLLPSPLVPPLQPATRMPPSSFFRTCRRPGRLPTTTADMPGQQTSAPRCPE